MIDALVPHFFTNQLTLEKLPGKNAPDQKTNYFTNSYARINMELATKDHLR